MSKKDEDKAYSEKYEQEHVHEVYEEIALHFSATRYKPWPIVESFLKGLSPGSVGIDVGCGNGKYLAVNKNIFILGSDRSRNLVKIAKAQEPHGIIVADSLSLPYHNGNFDFAISIAVIHHFSTTCRRRAAIRSVIECLNSDGKALIFVWALEQQQSRRGWKKGGEQDIMVPWVMKSNWMKAEESASSDKIFQRYYHLYRKGELEEDVQTVGGTVLECGYEKDNWWVICQNTL